MSKFSKLGLRRAAGACAVAAVAAVGMASFGAGDAAALPNGYKKATGIDGEVVQTWRTGESGLPAPSLANNGAGRSAVLSGVYTAKTSKGVTGNLAVKVLIGCQVDITGLEGGLSGTISATPTLSGSLTIPLKPGQVAVVSITDKDIKDKGVASVQLDRYEINVQQCGGYASARSIAKVIAAKGYNTDDGTVNGEGTLIQSTLYGQPFSLN